MHLLQQATYHHLRPSENLLSIDRLIDKKIIIKITNNMNYHANVSQSNG